MTKPPRRRRTVLSIALVLPSFALGVAPIHRQGQAQDQGSGDAERVVRVTTTAELKDAVRAAVPRTRIVVAAGEYRGFSSAGSGTKGGIAGTAEHPIVITAENPKSPPVIRGGLMLSDVAHLRLEWLVFETESGNGLNIDDGGSFETPSHHVVLHGLVARDCGGKGNEDGIKLSGVDDFRVEQCTVERWGRGGSAIDMVGCHRGTIEDCVFRDRPDPSGAIASSGVQAKGGSRDVTIRRCRFEHAGQRAVNIGGSTGLVYFRPKPEGFEAKDIVVEGNVFVGSLAPIACVGIDGATIRFNTFYRPAKWLLRILQETREPGFVACRNGAFTDNLVVYRADEVGTLVNVGPDTAPETFTFARNYWFASDAPGHSLPRLPVPETDAAGGADPLLRDIGQLDLRLEAESPAKDHGAEAWKEK